MNALHVRTVARVVKPVTVGAIASSASRVTCRGENGPGHTWRPGPNGNYRFTTSLSRSRCVTVTDTERLPRVISRHCGLDRTSASSSPTLAAR